MKFRGAQALLLAISVYLALSRPAQAQEIIYNNSDQPLKDAQGNLIASTIPTEYGEEIILGGTGRQVREFAFEYYADFFAQGDEYARVKFYKEDAGGWIQPNGLPSTEYFLPGSVIWDSGLFPVMQGYNTKDFFTEFSQKTVIVPNTFIWSIQFYGVTQNTTPGSVDRAGLLYYYFPTVGSSYNDIWEHRGAGWVPTARGDLAKNNFSAYLVANVPEPSVLALGTLGLGIGAVSLLRRSRKS